MKTLKLRKEVIANLTRAVDNQIKGGTGPTLTLPVTTEIVEICYATNGCAPTGGSLCYCPQQTTPEAGCPTETHAGKECPQTHECIPTGISVCEVCQEV